ncbi:Uncharacterized deaminase in luxG 3'region [Hyphomicrobiales bacterium]|nr:Uncharacterized deaminase in luxG 3'region [Hyphomicrobiales bacterium]CAH1671802.1 Uncharacterized deaminase in luxG 3'region [Hyphomicrobiales bacterium]
MGMAELVGSWSKDSSTQVGAVIAHADNRVVSVGYNGPPRGVEDDPSIHRDRKLRRTIHAEKNAILFARGGSTGATLYCTHHPCAQCAAMIVQAGIARVVIPPSQPEFMNRWASDIQEAAWILNEAGVPLDKVEPEWRRLEESVVGDVGIEPTTR